MEVPRLKKTSQKSLFFRGCWYVSKETNELDEMGYPLSLYLGRDGKWYKGMDISEGKQRLGLGGAYFKTIEEAIAVLAEFEINVRGEHDYETQASEDDLESR